MADLNKLLAKKQKEQKKNTLPTATVENVIGVVKELDITLLQDNPENARKTFNKDKVAALAESIKEKGLLQPVLVRPEGNKYLILAGHMRVRAYKLLNISKAPCIVKETVLSKANMKELTLVENLQRSDLNSLEIAEALYQLKESGLKQVTISQITGYDKSTVSQYLSTYEAVKDKPTLLKTLKDKGVLAAYKTISPRNTSVRVEPHPLSRFSVRINDINDIKQIEQTIKQLNKYTEELKKLLTVD